MVAQLDDIDLMKRIHRHDQQAFRLLYQQHGKAAYSLAYRVLQNSTQAEEVTQDAFMKVWQQQTRWDPEKGQLRSWLLTITHFTAIDRLRRERRQPNLHPESIEDMEEVLSSRSDALWQDDTVLRMLIRQLPAEQMALIDLAFFRGMSHSEIAAETHLPLGTVKTRLRSGLQRLRELWVETTKLPTLQS